MTEMLRVGAAALRLKKFTVSNSLPVSKVSVVFTGMMKSAEVAAEAPPKLKRTVAPQLVVWAPVP